MEMAFYVNLVWDFCNFPLSEGFRLTEDASEGVFTVPSTYLFTYIIVYNF